MSACSPTHFDTYALYEDKGIGVLRLRVTLVFDQGLLLGETGVLGLRRLSEPSSTVCRADQKLPRWGVYVAV